MTTGTTTFAQRRVAAIAHVHELAGNLKIHLGTGYPIETPHAVLIDNHFYFSLTLWPEGDNGLTGIGKGRPHTNLSVEV